MVCIFSPTSKIPPQRSLATIDGELWTLYVAVPLSFITVSLLVIRWALFVAPIPGNPNPSHLGVHITGMHKVPPTSSCKEVQVKPPLPRNYDTPSMPPPSLSLDTCAKSVTRKGMGLEHVTMYKEVELPPMGILLHPLYVILTLNTPQLRFLHWFCCWIFIL